MEPQAISETARAVTDYGVMAVISAVFIVILCAAAVSVLKWFKTLNTRMIDQWQEFANENRRQTQLLIEATEGMRAETQLRIRNISGFAFDLSIEQVCRLLKNVREQNHIADHEATDQKVRRLLSNIHDDRNSRFDTFTYRGRKLSHYTSPDWIEQVAQAVEAELYHPDGQNNLRAYNNIKAAYDKIKIDFYNHLNA